MQVQSNDGWLQVNVMTLDGARSKRQMMFREFWITLSQGRAEWAVKDHHESKELELLGRIADQSSL